MPSRLLSFLSSLSSPSQKEKQLWEACTSGNLPQIQKRLLPKRKNRKINLNWQDPEVGRTPLYRACANGHLGAARLLLENPRINCNLATNEGASPFLIACFQGHLALAKLLSKEARATASSTSTSLPTSTSFYASPPTSFYSSPLSFSPYPSPKHFEVARLLASDGRIDVNQPKKDGSTPLILACQFGLEEIVKFLLTIERVDVNQVQPEKNHSALFEAAQGNHLMVIKLLLASGRQVEVNQVSKVLGTTAAQQARILGHLEVAALIEAYLANPHLVVTTLRFEFGMIDDLASQMFALVVMHSDGFLAFEEDLC